MTSKVGQDNAIVLYVLLRCIPCFHCYNARIQRPQSPKLYDHDSKYKYIQTYILVFHQICKGPGKLTLAFKTACNRATICIEFYQK